MKQSESRDNPKTTATEVNAAETGFITSKTLRRVAVVTGIALGAYLLGFIPMWLNANSIQRELEETKVQMKPLTLRDALSNATISARRGDYEIARQRASEFFTALREDADRESSSVDDAAKRETINNILAQRDEIITLLARNDPAAADKLSDLYYNFLPPDRRPAPTSSP